MAVGIKKIGRVADLKAKRRLLEATQVCEAEYEAVGSQIIKDVGIPLFRGTPVELGRDSCQIVSIAVYRTGTIIREDRDKCKEAKVISKQAFALKKSYRKLY